MTSAHILYIPIIFSLGFLAGNLLSSGTTLSREQAGGQASSISGRGVLGSLLIFMLVFLGTHFFNIPHSSKAVSHALQGKEIFDKKPAFSSAEVYKRIVSFPEEGLQLYKQFTYTIDVLFPVTLFIFLFLLTRFVIKRFSVSTFLQRLLFLIPVLWFVSDMIENVVVFNLLEWFPVRLEFFAGILGYITLTKFTLLLLSILGPILILVTSKKSLA